MGRANEKASHRCAAINVCQHGGRGPPQQQSPGANHTYKQTALPACHRWAMPRKDKIGAASPPKATMKGGRQGCGPAGALLMVQFVIFFFTVGSCCCWNSLCSASHTGPDAGLLQSRSALLVTHAAGMTNLGARSAQL